MDRGGHRAWGLGGPVVRLGLSTCAPSVTELAGRIEAERRSTGRTGTCADLARRVASTGKPLTAANLEALATADAFACFGLTRRQAGSAAAGAAAPGPAGPAAQARSTGCRRRPGPQGRYCPAWTAVDQMVADVWATGLSPETHPARFIRGQLTSLGAVPIARLGQGGARADGSGSAAIVTHRQRPATAGGVTFLNLEDETGMLNVTCSPGLWQRYRRVARTSAALVVRGRLERHEGVTSLAADRLDAHRAAGPSRLPRLPLKPGWPGATTDKVGGSVSGSATGPLVRSRR